MDHNKILTEAIQKALDNGWQSTLASSLMMWGVRSDGNTWKDIWIERRLAQKEMYRIFPADIIYDHNFAKTLWGECKEPLSIDKSFDVHYPDGHIEHVPNAEIHYHIGCKDWQYHLQQMVIADDPIAYLGANI